MTDWTSLFMNSGYCRRPRRFNSTILIVSDADSHFHETLRPSFRSASSVRSTIRSTVRPSVHSSVHPLILPSVNPSVRPSVRVSVRRFVSLFIRRCVHHAFLMPYLVITPRIRPCFKFNELNLWRFCISNFLADSCLIQRRSTGWPAVETPLKIPIKWFYNLIWRGRPNSHLLNVGPLKVLIYQQCS